MRNAIRASQLFPATLRQQSSDASTPGQQLLVRSGYIRQLTSGVFTLGPLAMRVLWKVEVIVREEMNAIGGMEVNLPILQPAELWEQTGRWKRYVQDGIMFSGKDRRGQMFGLAPTAEEVVTAFVAADLQSYTQLPLTLWQMDWKFRDEIRPRLGLIRSRMFRMKDSYSFDQDEVAMRHSYEAHRQAYDNMFTRMGFKFISVQADSGAIGGKGSAEFMALSEYGEDVLLTCNHCNYGANRDKADAAFPTFEYDQSLRLIRKEATPAIRSVEELEKFFNLSARQMVKTIIYVADGTPVAVCCRGDLPINEVKLQNLLGASQMIIADDATVISVTKVPVGFAGPINLSSVRILFDASTEPMTNFLCGCNEEDRHMLDVNFGRDIPRPERFVDVHSAQAGDGCLECKTGVLCESRGIEMGHIFMLQQGYAEKLGCRFLGADGLRHYPWMGCYGVGTTRCIQALAEQHHDKDGLKWPVQVAPFQYVIVPTAGPGSVQHTLAESLFDSLADAGKEVVFDDRSLGFGARMKDALLLGYPEILVVGRGAEQGLIERQERLSGERTEISASQFDPVA